MPSPQHEPADVVPVEAIAFDEHCGGNVEGAAPLGAAEDGAGNGLTPPRPNSVDPIGMPERPTAAGGADAVGEEADAAGWTGVPSTMGAHALAPAAVLPPPSNTDAELPDVDIAVPGAPLGGEVAPNTSPPLKELPEHGAVLLVAAEPSGDMPTVGGMIAADPTPVGPKDVPVCGSAGADPMPSGEVAPIGAGAVALTCADAEPQATNSAATVPSNRRVSLVLIPIPRRQHRRPPLCVPGCRMS
jgi:hypothetical protein